jgi:hypothetical protein
MNQLKITNSEGTKFSVVILSKGDKYGLNDCLTHDEKEKLVEFYDKDQFVSRYYISTLLEGKRGEGLCLCGYEPSWGIDGKTMDKVRRFLSEIK